MRSSNSQTLKIPGITFGSIGIVFLIATSILAMQTRSFLEIGETTAGTVIDIVQRTSSSSETERTRTFYYPIIEFQARDGETIQFESRLGSNPPAFNRGENLTVIYDREATYRDRIKSATIYSFWNLWFIPVTAGAIGSFFTITGMLLLYISRRSRKPRLQK